MRYDFTSVITRTGKDALAVDAVGTFFPSPKEGFDVIPMWVADMNFATVPTIPNAIIQRAQHPLYGYFTPRQEYFDAIIQWHRRRNGVEELSKKHIGHSNGVLGGVVAALNVLCSRGDKVLLHAPTYIGFTHALEDNGYHIVHSPLVLDEDGIWRMDFADMEKKIVANKIHAAIFCSPHNPCGRVWERWEIDKAMALYQKHDVFVISDEIWSDIVLDGHTHIPTQSVSEDAKMRTIAMYAPSKTFNLAGLVGSYSIIYNTRLRDQFYKQIGLSHTNGMNTLSMYALIGGYSEEGHAWVDELQQVIGQNVDYACHFMAENWPGVTVSKPQGTYMLFIDCGQWCHAHQKTLDDVLQMCYDVGVMVQDGRAFHGPTHIRMNLALPLSRVQEAFRRLDQYVFRVTP